MTRRKTAERGYGGEHQAERERLRPSVEAGQAWCCEDVCLEERDGNSRWIAPDSEWHLAHGAGQQGYKGPAHARCNLSEVARRTIAVPRAPEPTPDSLWWRP